MKNIGACCWHEKECKNQVNKALVFALFLCLFQCRATSITPEPAEALAGVTEADFRIKKGERFKVEIKKIPLEERLKRLTSGYHAHSEYIPHAIQAMAHTPVTVYLRSFNPEISQLGDILEATENELDAINFQEAAARIHKLRLAPETRGLADKAAELLATPILQYYKDRSVKKAYADSD